MPTRFVALGLLLSILSAAGGALAAEAPKKDDGPKRVRSAGLVNTVAFYCKERRIPMTTKGEGKPGHVRIILVGGASYPEPEKTIDAANLTLKALDVWTGSQGVFVGPEKDKSLYYVIVLFQGNSQFASFVDWLRLKKVLPPSDGTGEDLIKKLNIFNGPRSVITTTQKAGRSPENFAIHCISASAMGAFFGERGKATIPAWITCGLSADLQKHITKKVLWSSIAYEMSSPNMQGNWARDVAGMIRRNDKQLRPARMVMNFSLISLPGEHYKLMWSLNTMMVRSAGNVKGAGNKYFKLLETMAKGTFSEDAVKKVYGAKDPKLSQQWFRWAQSQK